MRQDGSEEQRGSVVDPLVIGRRRATFFRRACAMLIDFFVAGMLFLGGLILPLVLLEALHTLKRDFPGYCSGIPRNLMRDERIARQSTVKCIDHVLPLFAGS